MSYTPRSGSWPRAKRRLGSNIPTLSHLGRSTAPLRPTYGPNESLYDREPYYHPDQFLEGQENFGPDQRTSP